MSTKIILLGPLPPPYGGVAIFTSTLFEFVRSRGVFLWTYGGSEFKGNTTSRFNHRRFGFVPLLLRGGYKARIIDSSHFLVEHPNPLLVPVWLLLKLLLRFRWVKVVHDGSLPSRSRSFGVVRRLLCKLSVRSVDEFAAVNDDISRWLRREMKVTRQVSTINALLPLPKRYSDELLCDKLQLALTRHKRLVCSTGVFDPSYGFKHAADCVEKLRRESSEDIGLLLIDGTFASNESYRAEVLRQRDWITVLENVPHPQVLEIFRKCDVFIRGFRFEGYGLSRIEAIWSGTTVVAAKGEEHRGMLLYDFGDEEGLLHQTRKALFDPQEEELRKWAAQFQCEAQENLTRWFSVLGLKDPADTVFELGTNS
jgi:glycosyltransferase involved in cell wall biosynthesis